VSHLKTRGCSVHLVSVCKPNFRYACCITESIRDSIDKILIYDYRSDVIIYWRRFKLTEPVFKRLACQYGFHPLKRPKQNIKKDTIILIVCLSVGYHSLYDLMDINKFNRKIWTLVQFCITNLIQNIMHDVFHTVPIFLVQQLFLSHKSMQ